MNCSGKTERVSQPKAVCKTCKKEYNADFLGAVNITRRLFSYMLNNLGDCDYRPKQGDEEPKKDTAPSFGITKGIVPLIKVSQP